MLDVDLVHDSSPRRDYLQLVECTLAPAQELVALPVSLVLQVDIALESIATAEHIGNHGVIDDQLCRRQRIDRVRIAAQSSHRLAHRGQIDQTGHAGEILHNDPSRSELDLSGRLRLRVPTRKCRDVFGRDMCTDSA